MQSAIDIACCFTHAFVSFPNGVEVSQVQFRENLFHELRLTTQVSQHVCQAESASDGHHKRVCSLVTHQEEWHLLNVVSVVEHQDVLVFLSRAWPAWLRCCSGRCRHLSP